ncbi:ABC transporter sub-family G-like protein, partial [Euroglyphus maynei]
SSSSYYINTTFTLNDENASQSDRNDRKPIALRWKNLRYEVNEWHFDNDHSWIGWPQRHRKVILRRLNGSLRENSLNALLGPSGAGKTSLIKCLTGNVSGSNMTSDTEIYMNRAILDQHRMNKRMSLVGSVPQSVHEIVFGRFTVNELLHYAFRFKNPFGQRHRANEHIVHVMEQLMLDPRILDTRFEQCSGGEQRRVAIAQELMSIELTPPFLFVDEPTTGLDSEAALLVMQCLQRLSANNSLTIMASIHAPSSEILMLFDHVYILAKGGVCIYSGQPNLMRSYLRQTLQLEIDADRSPIEEYLRIASNGWYSLSTFFFAFQLGQLAQMSVSILNITMVAYFTGGYFTIDHHHLNWNRIGHLFLYFWLLMVYLQSHGQFAALVFMDNIQIMTICLQLVYALLMMMNGISITLEIMDKPWLLSISQWLGIRHLADGLLFSFYGIDRCDREEEYSFILADLNVNPDDIYANILASAFNISAIRVATFLLMYFRFTFIYKHIVRRFEPTPRSALAIAIDYDDEQYEKEQISADQFHRNVKHNHNQQQRFLLGRHIIGWRSLYVFATESIYENRPSPQSHHEDQTSKRLILRNLNGQLRFGTINALMGTSGSGKTSLLKVLNGRMKTRLANCTEFHLSKYVAIRTCFITQEVSGHLMPGLTARQSLIYASRLKNHHVQHHVDHEQLAMKILDELDLTDTANTMVQHCSGGQRKRLALALELTSIQMPNLICIDEPTSGLDSNSARLVVQTLDQLVNRHPDICIVASIHQPNTELLMMFHHCYVLARDGLCIYSGQPSRIKQYLDDVSVSQSDRDRFPIEQLIKYSCCGRDNPVVRQMAEMSEKFIRQTDDLLGADTVAIADGVEFNRIRFSLRSLWLSSERYLVFLIRHQWKEWLVFLTIYLALGISLIVFYNANITKPSGCLNLEDDFLAHCSPNKTADRMLEERQISNSIYYISESSMLFTLFLSVHTMFAFINELKYFSNEHRNGWYSCGVFYLQKFLFETIPLIPIIMAYVSITDIFSNVSANHYYEWQVIVLLLASISFQAISHLVALLTNGHFVLMIICLASFCTSFMIFSNVFNPIEQLSFGLRLLSHLSVYRFVNQADFWLVYGGDRCHEHEIQSVLYQLMIPNTIQHFHYCIIMLVALALFYHCLAFSVLIFKSNPMKSRRSRAQRIQRYNADKLRMRTTIPTGSDNFITIRL